MKRSDLVAIHAELVAERAARRKMNPEQRQRYDALRDLPMTAARKREDPEATARYLAKLAMRLRGGENLPGDVRVWLAGALIEAALKPESAGAALRLVRRRARPPAPPQGIREAIAIVAELQAHGVPLRDTRKQRGALSIAAERARRNEPAEPAELSESAILRQWQKKPFR